MEQNYIVRNVNIGFQVESLLLNTRFQDNVLGVTSLFSGVSENEVNKRKR